MDECLYLKQEMKIEIYGPSKVGKSSISFQICFDHLPYQIKSSSMPEYHFNVFYVGDTSIRVNITDYTSSPDYKPLIKTFCRAANGFILVSDATNIETRKE